MSLKSRSTVNAPEFFSHISKMGARQGLAQTHIAAYDHAQRSAPPIDLVWLTWSWMTDHDLFLAAPSPASQIAQAGPRMGLLTQ